MSILLSVRPEWVGLILSGKKTIEVRRNVPRDLPEDVFIYCTSCGKKLDTVWRGGTRRCNGLVVAMARVETAVRYPYDGSVDCGYRVPEDVLARTCLTREALMVYGAGRDLWLWELEGVKAMEPVDIREVGGVAAPQSWCYARR